MTRLAARDEKANDYVCSYSCVTQCLVDTKSRFPKNKQRAYPAGLLIFGETTLAKKIVGSSIHCTKVKYTTLITI
jgi:hypothetical protein